MESYLINWPQRRSRMRLDALENIHTRGALGSTARSIGIRRAGYGAELVYRSPMNAPVECVERRMASERCLDFSGPCGPAAPGAHRSLRSH